MTNEAGERWRDGYQCAATLTARERAVLRAIVEGGGPGRSVADSVAVAVLLSLRLIDMRKVFVATDRGVEALRDMTLQGAQR